MAATTRPHGSFKSADSNNDFSAAQLSTGALTSSSHVCPDTHCNIKDTFGLVRAVGRARADHDTAASLGEHARHTLSVTIAFTVALLATTATTFRVISTYCVCLTQCSSDCSGAKHYQHTNRTGATAFYV